MPELDLASIHLPHTNPYLMGNFAPVLTETTAFDLPVEGEIPLELEGRLLRVGPNPTGTPEEETHHWFMGSGMAHGLRLRGGKAEWYRNRFVVDDITASSLGRPPLPGPRNGRYKNVVNTNILDIAGRTYATVEAGGLPVELTYTLESSARSDFRGSLQHGFVAHPKLDPKTGELHAITYEPGLSNLSYIVVGKDGLSRSVAEIAVPNSPMVHDMGFTATKVIVLDLPVTFNKAEVGRSFPYTWNAQSPARVGLLPRSGNVAELRWFEAPACFVFHIMNAFDRDNTVVLDVVRHSHTFDQDRRGPSEAVPRLVRWTIDLATGSLQESILEERGCEFPRFNDAYAGQAYKYGYTASMEGLRFGPAYKHDVSTGRTEVHDYGPYCVTLEPVFVPKQAASAEDDGWIISFVYDAARDASDVVIVDAQAFSEAPVARIRLPVRVPFGFHGNWVPDPV